MFGKASEPKLKENKKIQEILSHVGSVEDIGSWVGPRIDRAGHSLASGIEKAVPKLHKSLDEVVPKVTGALDNTAPKLHNYLSTTVPEFIRGKERIVNEHLTQLSEKLRSHGPKLTKGAKKKAKAEFFATMLAEFGINKRHVRRQLKKLSKTAARAAQEAERYTKGKARKYPKQGITRGRGWLIALITLVSGVALISLWRSTRPADEDEADQESQWQAPVIDPNEF